MQLKAKTLVYWNICSAFNGRPSQYANLHTGKAINLLNQSLVSNGGLINLKLQELKDEIVRGPLHAGETEQTANSQRA